MSVQRFILITCDGVLDGLKKCSGRITGNATAADSMRAHGWRKLYGCDLCPNCYKRNAAIIKKARQR